MPVPEQPKTQHEIGKRTYIIAPVEPLDVDGIRTVQVGSALWILAFVALLPFYGRLQETGRSWWLWTCWAGFAIGLFGYEYARRRRAKRSGGKRAASRTSSAAEETTRHTPGRRAKS
ncbi:MAG: DUF2530 domain-containing protein [Nocardioides sp.]